MTIINLRDFFYWYKIDVYIEVSDEVAQELRSDKAYEFTHWRRMKRNNANYSLDAEDGIENAASEFETDPEALALWEERIMLLCHALNSLNEKQGRRIDAHIILGKKLVEIAAEEGVSASTVGKSVQAGLDRMKTYLLRHGF